MTVAKALADAALTGALANVNINLDGLEDTLFVTEIRGKVKAITG